MSSALFPSELLIQNLEQTLFMQSILNAKQSLRTVTVILVILVSSTTRDQTCGQNQWVIGLFNIWTIGKFIIQVI